MPSLRLIFARHGDKCVYCGAKADTCDHVIPRRVTRRKRRPAWMPTINAPENLLPACAACNNAKGSMDVREFLASRPNILASVVEKMAAINPAARELLEPRA